MSALGNVIAFIACAADGSSCKVGIRVGRYVSLEQCRDTVPGVVAARRANAGNAAGGSVTCRDLEGLCRGPTAVTNPVLRPTPASERSPTAIHPTSRLSGVLQAALAILCRPPAASDCAS